MLIENFLHHSRHLFDLQRTTLTCPAKSANSKRSSQVSLTHNPCTRISEQKRQPVAFRPKNMSDGCLDITWFGTLESNFNSWPESSCSILSQMLSELVSELARAQASKLSVDIPAKTANSERSSQVSLTHNPCSRIPEQKRQPAAFR